MFSDSGFKEQLRDELAARGGGVSSGVAADALAHGRRLRRRQRHVRILSGTGAVAAVAVGAVVLSGRLGPGNAGPDTSSPGQGATGTTAVRTPGTSPTSTLSGTPSGTASPPSTPSGSTPSTNPSSGGAAGYPSSPPSSVKGSAWRIVPLPSLSAPVPATPPANGIAPTAKAYAALLKELLAPGGTFPSATGSVMSPTQVMTQVQVAWSVGGGTAEAQVFLAQPGVATPNAPLCDGSDQSSRTVTCAYGTLADGSQVRVLHIEGKAPASGGTALKEIVVLLDRADGVQIEVHVANGYFIGDGPRLAQIPITEQQVYAIAADPRWGFSMDPAFVQHAEATVVFGGH